MTPRGKLFAVDAGGLAPGVMTESDELESGFLVVADVVGAAEKFRIARTEALRCQMPNQAEPGRATPTTVWSGVSARDHCGRGPAAVSAEVMQSR